MHPNKFFPILYALLFAAPVLAQDVAEQTTPACLVQPVFHCVEHLQGGSAIGRFGYTLQCPEDVQTPEDIYIEIGADNRFAPGREDRGQPKVFLPGRHDDEFEVEFSLAEVKGDSVMQWSVLGQTATVDFSITKDRSLDCSVLP